MSLAVELDADGVKTGEWFCRDFDQATQAPLSLIRRLLGERPSARASATALQRLAEVRDSLQPDVLYGFYGQDGNLIEHEFAELRVRGTS